MPATAGARKLLELLLHSASERTGSTLSSQAELTGPQVPDKALKQNDVDDLLASFGF